MRHLACAAVGLNALLIRPSYIADDLKRLLDHRDERDEVTVEKAIFRFQVSDEEILEAFDAEADDLSRLHVERQGENTIDPSVDAGDVALDIFNRIGVLKIERAWDVLGTQFESCLVGNHDLRSLPQPRTVASFGVDWQRWSRRLGLDQAPMRQDAQRPVCLLRASRVQPPICDEYQAPRDRHLGSDAQHVGVILVNVPWTQDVGNDILAIVVFGERPLNTSETGMSTFQGGQLAITRVVPLIHSGHWRRHAQYDAPELKCRLATACPRHLDRVA